MEGVRRGAEATPAGGCRRGGWPEVASLGARAGSAAQAPRVQGQGSGAVPAVWDRAGVDPAEARAAGLAGNVLRRRRD